MLLTVGMCYYRFDTTTLPADMQRVYKELSGRFGKDYALKVIFSMRTAIELHRAWHMTLLTDKILQQLKDQFGLRMTWNLGVFRLQFRFQDGDRELQRKGTFIGLKRFSCSSRPLLTAIWCPCSPFYFPVSSVRLRQ